MHHRFNNNTRSNYLFVTSRCAFRDDCDDDDDGDNGCAGCGSSVNNDRRVFLIIGIHDSHVRPRIVRQRREIILL